LDKFYSLPAWGKKTMDIKKSLCADGRWIIAGALLVLLMTAISGCSAKYGRLNRSPEITQAFKDYQVLPDHRYYYYGRSNLPFALVGIHNEYELLSRIWQEIDLDNAALEKYVYWVWEMNNYDPYGAKLLDPSGEQVGVWYSSIPFATIKMYEDNRTLAIIPHPGMVIDGDLDGIHLP
jgi:hypothetical protein